MTLLLLLIVLVCTAIGALVGHPAVGLVAGVVIAALLAWSASAPY